MIAPLEKLISFQNVYMLIYLAGALILDELDKYVKRGHLPMKAQWITGQVGLPVGLLNTLLHHPSDLVDLGEFVRKDHSYSRILRANGAERSGAL